MLNPKIKGDLHIHSLDDAKKYAYVTEVGGDLFVHEGAKGAQFPVLTSIGGYLDNRAEGAQFPVLTSIGGYLYNRAEGAQFPVLTSIGGSLFNRAEGAQFPVLTSIGGEPIETSEVYKERMHAVAEAALENPAALEMGAWHTCKTTHCIAGWAIQLAGKQGHLLEKKHGPQTAGAILLGPQAACYFQVTNEKAREVLKSWLEGDAK